MVARPGRFRGLGLVLAMALATTGWSAPQVREVEGGLVKVTLGEPMLAFVPAPDDAMSQWIPLLLPKDADPGLGAFLFRLAPEVFRATRVPRVRIEVEDLDGTGATYRLLRLISPQPGAGPGAPRASRGMSPQALARRHERERAAGLKDDILRRWRGVGLMEADMVPGLGPILRSWEESGFLGRLAEAAIEAFQGR